MALPADKLSDELAVLETKLITLKLKVAAGKLDNHSEIGKAKRNIARILTLINGKVAN